MNPGKRDITTKTEMVEMSGMTVPPGTHINRVIDDKPQILNPHQRRCGFR